MILETIVFLYEKTIQILLKGIKMKTLRKIIKSTFFFGCFYMAEKLLVSIFFYEILQKKFPLEEVLIHVISNNSSQIIDGNFLLVLFLTLDNLIELIGFSILTSYIFTYMLNREPKIVLPDKLVIRHSNNSETMLLLGVMIQNRNRLDIFNVECTITCYYIKGKDPLLANADFKIKKSQPLIKNYYRFSFPLKDFPTKLLKDLIDKNPVGYNEDAITVLLTGNANFLGNTFGIVKKYHLSDIVFSEQEPKPQAFILNPFTQEKVWSYINWKKLENIIPMDEGRRKDTIDEMKAIIAYKENISETSNK